MAHSYFLSTLTKTKENLLEFARVMGEKINFLDQFSKKKSPFRRKFCFIKKICETVQCTFTFFKMETHITIIISNADALAAILIFTIKFVIETLDSPIRTLT